MTGRVKERKEPLGDFGPPTDATKALVLRIADLAAMEGESRRREGRPSKPTLGEQLEVFLACHERAFADTGGVVRRVVYDNLRSVVLAHVGSDVRLNPRFLDFSAHYGFKPVA